MKRLWLIPLVAWQCIIAAALLGSVRSYRLAAWQDWAALVIGTLATAFLTFPYLALARWCRKRIHDREAIRARRAHAYRLVCAGLDLRLDRLARVNEATALLERLIAERPEAPKIPAEDGSRLSYWPDILETTRRSEEMEFLRHAAEVLSVQVAWLQEKKREYRDEDSALFRIVRTIAVRA